MEHRIIQLAAALTLMAGAAQAATFNNGQINTVSTDLGDSVTVFNSTTVDFQTGGSARGTDELGSGGADTGGQVIDGSTLIMSGGSIKGGSIGISGFGGDGVRINNSSLTMLSGIISGGDNLGSGFTGLGLRAQNSNVTISGGTITTGDHFGSGLHQQALILIDSSFDIDGGTIQLGSGVEGFSLASINGASSGTISGGTFSAFGGDLSNFLLVGGTSAVTISGGTFGGTLVAQQDSVLTLKGTGLSQDQNGLVTGNLLDGTVFSQTVTVRDNGQLILQNVGISAVPLPAAGWMLLVGIGGIAAVKRGTQRRA